MVGGGVAGVAAAVTACRRGIRTVLVEKELSLGGTATLGLTGTICGLYRNGGTGPGELLNGGLTAETVELLCSMNPLRAPRKTGRVFVLPYGSDDLRQLLERLCRNEELLTVCLGASAVSVTARNGVVTGVAVDSAGQRTVFAPMAVVDASGSGEAAFLAGAEFEKSPEDQLQLAGFTARIIGLDATDDSLAIKVPFAVAKGIDSGRVPAAFRYTVFSPGESTGEGLLKINLPDDPAADESRTADDVAALVSWLAGELPAFMQASIAATSGRRFSREGRRIVGCSLLTGDDVLSGRKFSDGLVRGAWPMEIWSRERGVSYRYPPDGDYYEIPAGCIRAKGFSNLFMAGRCISVTHEALGSTRVIATCIALGEQAGLAAAKSIESKSNHI